MDWQNEEPDYPSVESFMWEEKGPLTKSRSDASILTIESSNVRTQGIQVEPGGCRESRSFTSAFECLQLETGVDAKEVTLTSRTQEVQTYPCTDCLEHSVSMTGFQTREISSLRLVVHGPEILNYQGIRQAPEDVAPYWKKDSRMWLWKSVRLARRKRNKSKSSVMLCSLNHEHEDIK